jgi:hypothetical protein
VQDLDGLDAPPHDELFKATPDYLDLGQFWH